MSIFILNMPFAIKNVFPFPLAPAKLISDYFDNRRCGSNNTVILIMHQFICAPNVWSVKRDEARTRKIRNFKSVSQFALRIRSASPLTQETLMRHCLICLHPQSRKSIQSSELGLPHPHSPGGRRVPIPTRAMNSQKDIKLRQTPSRCHS